MVLGELNRILDDWCEIKVIQDDGDGEVIELTTKTKVDYFNEHWADEVTFITQRDGNIVIFTDKKEV